MSMDDSDTEDTGPIRQPSSSASSSATKATTNLKRQSLDAALSDSGEALSSQAATNKRPRVTETARSSQAGATTLPAESGIIENVTLVNFMCHKFLNVAFGPQMNFIIGNNGSGKSVVLTAITVALGNRAQTTNRAASMKGLIREGASAAEITLKLKNQGPDAFKFDEYGPSILIVRTISREGANGYKIKSAKGRVVSNKKEELTAICDHMGLQPDNPMLILGQDAARDFLTSSTPEDRYKMFLRGTELQRLSEDYQQVQGNLDRLTLAAEKKTESLTDLKKNMQRAENKMKMMQAAVNLDAKIKDLKREMAWSQVYDLEKDRDEMKGRFKEVKEKHEGAEEMLRAFEQKIVDANIEKDALEKEITDDDAQLVPLTAAYNSALNEFEKRKQSVADAKKQVNEVNDSIRSKKQDEEHITERIEEIMDKEASQTGRIELEKKRSQLSAKTAELQTLKDQKKQAVENLQHLTADQNRMNDLQNNIRNMESKHSNDASRVDGVKADLHRARNAGNNKFSRFGERVPEMLEHIEQLHRSRKFSGPKPIGPIGAFLQVRGKKFDKPLDVIVGRNLYAFVVQNPRDTRTLQDVFKRYNYGPNRYGVHDVICNRMDNNFNFTNGLPPRDNRWVTVLDELTIEDPLILQVLVTNANIESTILVERRTIGEEVMRGTWPRNVTACFDADCNKIGARGGGQANFNMSSSNGASTVRRLCSDDNTTYIADLEQHLDMSTQDLAALGTEIRNRKAEYRQIQDSVTRGQEAAQILDQHIQNCERFMLTLEDEINNLMTDSAGDRVQALKDQLAALKDTIDSLKAQLPDIMGHVRELIRAQNEAKIKLDGTKKDSLDARSNIDAQKRILTNMKSSITSLTNKLGEMESEKANADRTIRNAREAYEEKEKLLFDGTNTAMQYCDNVPIEKKDLTYRTSERLVTVLNSSIEQLKAREKELGSLDEATAKFADANEKHKTAVDDVEKTVKFATALKTSMKTRIARWELFRQHISIRASLLFLQLLQNRGYAGKLTFHHAPISKLDLHVETEDIAPTQVAATQVASKSSRGRRDPRGLSGGEKSFSTVCLLLALWEAMATNIRALDEFDVFMDSVNRQTSTAMILESARSSPCTQFILITPQSMDKVAHAADVRIIRMADPEREWRNGQQTLGFRPVGEEDQEE